MPAEEGSREDAERKFVTPTTSTPGSRGDPDANTQGIHGEAAIYENTYDESNCDQSKHVKKIGESLDEFSLPPPYTTSDSVETSAAVNEDDLQKTARDDGDDAGCDIKILEEWDDCDILCWDYDFSIWSLLIDIVFYRWSSD